MLGRILVEVGLHDSGSNRQKGGTNAFIVGPLLSYDIGVDILLVRVIEGQRGIDLSERERRAVRGDLLRREPPVALNRDGSYANACSGDDRPTAA